MAIGTSVRSSARNHIGCATADDVAGLETGDRLRSRVPVADDPRLVDQEDAAVHVLEHPRMLEFDALLVDLPVESAHPDRAVERGDEVVAVDRFLDEVEGAAAQRLYRKIVLAVVISGVGVPGRSSLISVRSARPSMPEA